MTQCTNRQTDTMDKQTGRQMDKQTKGQTERQKKRAATNFTTISIPGIDWGGGVNRWIDYDVDCLGGILLNKTV